LPDSRSRGEAPGAARRRDLSAREYIDGVLAGDRVVLARAITLVESNAPAHQDLAQEVLTALLPQRGASVRIGITGVPGAGKSTLVEALGTRLTARGHRVAVTAVDPSSTVSGGSVLGDKTRMEKLAADPAAFIRPSPSGGTLGGVARKTRETIVLFEAAGYDVVLIETVGVGQSEVVVRSMADLFLLVLIAGAGDELQGIKKGVVELADAVIVNKADGDGAQAALRARAEFERVLHYLRPATEGWTTQALAVSALTGEGLDPLWAMVGAFVGRTRQSGAFDRRRAEQERAWVRALVDEGLRERFRAHPAVAAAREALEAQVVAGALPATLAARRLLDLFGGPGAGQGD
ncbi:MAG TPA: methylmalonyl Co-A mutase-associated GTPase MeaB, partial [Candidatus Krumholzibacteria bacterium]|nr:methylmalonyl Co-A mutase-associated GTPase MeaB [Candidatus Krumholzibacteria bacterium]